MRGVRSIGPLLVAAASSVSGCSLLAPGDDELVGTRPEAGANGYSSVVMRSAPLGYWRLEEPAGATLALDASGNGHDAVIGGAPGGAAFGATGLVEGSSGALELDGRGFLDVPAATPFRFAGAKPFSLEAWLVPRALTAGSTVRNIATSQPLSDNSEGWYWFHNASLLEAERRSGGAVQGAYGAGALGDDERVFLVATWDGDHWRLYLNGALLIEDGGEESVSIADVANAFRWGGRASDDESNLFVGVLDELAVYDRALTSIDVAQHHAAGAGL
jgi:hypothetical protein